MVDYVKIFTEVVNPTPSTKLPVVARARVYRSGLQALEKCLSRLTPPVPDEQVQAERRKLLAAAEFVEKQISNAH